MNPEQVKVALGLADKRAVFAKMRPRCPHCDSEQVQLVAWFNNGEFRCRRCRFSFSVEYK